MPNIVKQIVIAGLLAALLCLPTQAADRIPIIYSTDLAHPHGDPDDHFDLAALFAMREFDIKGIVLDRRASTSQPPGEAPMQQMLNITGRKVPYAAGLKAYSFTNRTDKCLDQAAEYQGGVELILQQLRDATQKVDVMLVGSCRDFAAAYNREPELVTEKVKSVYIDAGNGPGGTQNEHNVALDAPAYQRLFESGLSIYWLPCYGTSGYQTYYQANQQAVIGAGSLKLQKYFQYCLSVSTADPIEFLSSTDAVPAYSGTRNMWCTPGLIAAAGRKIYQRGDNDYVALSPVDAEKAGLSDDEITVFQFVPMQATVNGDGSLTVALNPSGETDSYVFQVTDSRYQQVMSSCLKNFMAEVQHVPEPGNAGLLTSGSLACLVYGWRKWKTVR